MEQQPGDLGLQHETQTDSDPGFGQKPSPETEPSLSIDERARRHFSELNATLTQYREEKVARLTEDLNAALRQRNNQDVSRLIQEINKAKRIGYPG